MLKKLLMLIMVVLLTFSVFVGCVDKDNNTKTTSADDETTADTVVELTTEFVDAPVSEQTEPSVENNYTYSDTAAMSAVEQKDTFSVKVSDFRIAKQIYDDGSVVSFDGKDGIIVNVKNNTNSVVDKVCVLVYCTGTDGKGVDLGGLASINNISFGDSDKLEYSNKVKFMGSETASIDKYGEKEFAIRCDANKINTVNVIVYYYVDANGVTVYNENCYEWLENSYEGYVIN